jgi:4-nitrophenyl phosphatase
MKNELIDELKDIKLAIFDLDGVVYRGFSLIPNMDKNIKILKENSIKVVYNSNNSTITRQIFVDRLKNFGIPSNLSDFYTSAYITAAEITKIKENSKIYVIGENGIIEELKALGHSVIRNVKDYNEIDFVIVGLDMKINYKKIVTAQKCILEGKAQFYATNPDTTYPLADGLWPGAGVMVNAVQTCTGKAPVKIFGKPEPHGLKLILDDTKTSHINTWIFGDRLDTDILAGKRAGIMTACVLTGVTSREMIESIEKGDGSNKEDLKPDIVINSLEEIFKT